MRVSVTTGDITAIPADAIVNAANSSLLGGGGVDGAIHRAGGRAILDACRALRESSLPDGLATGDAVATTAGDLPARHVIHTVGPVHGRDAPELLDSCYRSSLHVAHAVGAGVVTFPLISAGAYGWPKDDAIRRALLAMAADTSTVEHATLVLFSEGDLAEARAVAEREGVELTPTAS